MAKKSKKEQRKMEHRWKLAARIFHLSPRHIRMAKLLGANPQWTFDKWRDIAKERGISLATYVERRYVASYGNRDPVAPAQKTHMQKELPAKA